MISVCIATFNGARFITEQIESILPQLGSEDEIIVSDDGSTDATLAILRNLDVPQLRIVQNLGKHGYTPNFENALCEARGEYIFLCDQDDIWQPNKVETCMQYLRDYSMVVSDARIVSADGTPISPSFFEVRHTRHGFINQLLRFSYLGCCLAFRREVLRRALPFPSNHRYCTHDNWLTLIALAFHTVKIIDRPLLAYRRHDNNASTGGVKQHTSLSFKIAYRAYLVRHLICRI